MKHQAKVITPQQLNTLRRPLPESWKKAFGLLKGREGLLDPVKYQKEIRKGWEERLKRQIKLATRKHV